MCFSITNHINNSNSNSKEKNKMARQNIFLKSIMLLDTSHFHNPRLNVKYLSSCLDCLQTLAVQELGYAINIQSITVSTN